MKKVEHLIKEVYPGSIAEELEIEPEMYCCRSMISQLKMCLIIVI